MGKALLLIKVVRGFWVIMLAGISIKKARAIKVRLLLRVRTWQRDFGVDDYYFAKTLSGTEKKIKINYEISDFYNFAPETFCYIPGRDCFDEEVMGKFALCLGIGAESEHCSKDVLWFLIDRKEGVVSFDAFSCENIIKL